MGFLGLVAVVAPALADLEGFSPDVASKLEKLIDSKRGVAVFDADKTLWYPDVGEAFFDWLVRERKLPALEGIDDPSRRYHEMLEKDRVTAYAWLVKMMSGVPEDQVRRWARAFFRVSFARRVYRPQRALIRRLREAGWDIWIVSASNLWIVQAGAPYLGVEPEHAIGIKVRVENGVLTQDLDYAVPSGPGKVQAIEAFIGKRPDLVSGDSIIDRDMLEYSQGLALLILYPSNPQQEEIRRIARERGWLMQQF